MSDAPAEQNRTTLGYVKNDRTIPASDPSSGLMFTATVTLKQWNSAQVKCNLLFCFLSVRQLTMQERDDACLIFLQDITKQILLKLLLLKFPLMAREIAVVTPNSTAELDYGWIGKKKPDA